MSGPKNYTKFCSSPEDLYGKPLPAFRTTIMFVLLNSTNKRIQIECHDIDQIKDVIKNSEVYQDYPSKIDKLFKLPLSGLWCQTSLVDTAKFNTFIVDSLGTRKIGSEFGVSRLHGAEEKVFRLIPFNRDILLQILNQEEDKRYDAILKYLPSENIEPNLDSKSDVIDASEDGIYGIIYYASRNKYKGDLKNNVPDGEGIMKYADGSNYEGQWKKGKRNGTGTLTSKTGTILYEGEWKEDNQITQKEEKKEEKEEEKSSLKMVACGFGHSMVLKYDGTLWACGGNSHGQLGLENNKLKYTFTKVNINDVKQVACGVEFTAALKNDGTLWTCGDNQFGQLGNSNQLSENKFNIVEDIKDVKEIACGDHFIMALKNDGTLWSCGNNDNGQLGLRDNDNRNRFTQTGLDNVKMVACGGYHTMILKHDGTIWSCGNNDNGQLGLGDNDNRNRFKQIGLDNVKMVACGGYHTMILKHDGTLMACGNNSNNQLGFGDEYINSLAMFEADEYGIINVNELVPVPIKNVKDVFCGMDYTMIIKNDGTLWGCGNNVSGQMSIRGEDEIFEFTQASGITNVSNVACAQDFTLVIKNDTTLWGCGNNIDGQLGIGSTTRFLDTYIKIIF